MHSIENPPAQDFACYITLNLTNSTGLIDLLKFGGGDQTEYILTLKQPLQVGFTSGGQSNRNTDLNNFALSMNLALSATCVMQSKIESVDSKVKFKPAPTKPATITDDEQGHFTVSAQETVLITDPASIAFGMQEDIDEPTLLAIFKRVQNARRLDVTSTSPYTESNLTKALKAYEIAMKSPDRLDIFKNLYTTIELAANYDGSKDHDIDLDKKINALTHVAQTDAENWRDLNNRAKHADKAVDHIETYLKLVAELPTMNRKVRDCARTLLLARLPL